MTPVSRLHSLSPKIQTIDAELYQLAQNMGVLRYIAPSNLEQEKQRFLSDARHHQPQFVYPSPDIALPQIQKKLVSLNIDDMDHAGLHHLYHTTIEQLLCRIELLSSIGTPDFLAHSIECYGKPDDIDLFNAQSILACDEYQPPEDFDITPEEAMDKFKQAAETFGFIKDHRLLCDIELKDNMVARVSVTGKRLKINQAATFGQQDLQALIHHELGTHLLTSINAEQQPLMLFTMGLAGNTHTQEGLAILVEYASGYLSLQRLKRLALRVVIVDMMVQGASFFDIFHTLKQDHDQSDEAAFTMATRVYRGGGFTKDYLYLRGFRDVLKVHQRQESLSALFIGKTGLAFKHALEDLIAENIVSKPMFIPQVLSSNNKATSELHSLVMTLR